MLNIAANHAKEHAAADGMTVEIAKGDERYVKVNGVAAFQHASHKSLECGTDAGPVADRPLPEWNVWGAAVRNANQAIHKCNRPP